MRYFQNKLVKHFFDFFIDSGQPGSPSHNDPAKNPPGKYKFQNMCNLTLFENKDTTVNS